MSLRRDVHSAFDVLAPQTAGMPERVVRTVLAERKARQRKERMLLRLRAPLSLVAVLLFVALVAAVFAGTRLIQDWNAFHNATPAGPSARDLQIAQLEARPMHIPLFQSSADCVSAEGSSTGIMRPPTEKAGQGPVYGIWGPSIESSWGTYFHNFLYVDAPLTGPILVRGMDVFTGTRVVFVGQGAIGPSVGSDTQDGQRVQQHTELLLDPHATATSPDPYWGTPITHHRYEWYPIVGVPKSWSNSTGWQFDSGDFSELALAC